jgi:hypothetical protein
MIGHKEAQAAMADEFFVIEFHRGEHMIASACAARLVFAGGTQLMVIKNQLPSATHCGIVSGSFLRIGKATRGA